MTRGSLSLVSFVALAFGLESRAGQSVELELSELPPAILAKAKSAVPNAVFRAAIREEEDDGVVVYEVIGTEPEHEFATVAEEIDKIKISEFDDDGFGLQLIKVTLSDVEVEVDLFEDGTVEEVERVIPVKLVPGMVLKRVRDSYPEIQIGRIEASYNEHGKIFRYELEGSVGGRNVDLEVSADGSSIVEADA